jgi:hypothetical protein
LKSLKREDRSRKQPERIRKKHSHSTDYDVDCDIHSYTRYKAKKEFESVLNDEIKNVEEESEARKKLKRDDSDNTKDEEIFIIIEHRSYPLTVINTPIQDNLTPFETQPVVKHRKIFRDDN